MSDAENITKPRVKRKKKWYRRWYTIAGLANLWLPIVLAINSMVKDDTPIERLSFMYSTVQDNYVNHKMHTSYFMTINNAGKSSFQIKGVVRAKIWYIPIDMLTKRNHFDWEQYMRTKACDSVFYSSSYIGEYAPGDSVRNSFDFFTDSIKADSLKYTILVRADAHFETTYFLIFHTTDPDFCYNALIRYKIVDSASTRRDIKNTNKKLPKPSPKFSQTHK